MKEFVKNIMGQFTIETMSGNSAFDMSEFNLKLDDDYNIASLQAQGGFYALHAKRFLLVDLVEPQSPAGIVSASKKANIQNGIDTKTFYQNAVMKHLLTLSEMDLLSSHTAMLTAHSILKDVEDINKIPKEIMNNYLFPETVALSMGFYVATICIGNSHYNPDSFNRIFANSWHNYYETAMAKLMMIRMAGNTWKQQFSGCLFDYK